MFTPDNYYSKIKDIDFSALPEVLRKGHEFADKVSNNGSDWANYYASSTVRKAIDGYFLKLAEYISTHKKTVSPAKPQKAKKESPAKKEKGKPHKVVKQTENTRQPVMVERIPDDVRIIKRFVHLNNKTKTKEELLAFINSLQKAILEKKIRKTSSYVEQIRFIQDKLLEIYNSMGKEILITLKPETLEEMTAIAENEMVLPSVGFIKRYINLNGKPGIKEKAKVLLGQLNRAFEHGKIKDNDPYITEIEDIKKNLEHYIGETRVKVLEIERTTLNGLQGILGCACNNLNGTATKKPYIMNSMDFANMQFKTLGFTGKWLELIGDPSANFTAMVYGKPKFGKSYLCIDFAGYLARHHGRVLYVAREEGLDKTLQDKIRGKNVKHPNLIFASRLPSSLSGYDFIFLDSVTKLGLTTDDLEEMKHANPTKSFIYIFQTTKDGNFRGVNGFQHDVDVVIEVPERGRAVQNGRFNQGGEISIF